MTLRSRVLATSFLQVLIDVIVGAGGIAVVSAVTLAAIVVVHETAHAVVGWLLGFRILAIEFGRGPVWHASWIGRTVVTWSRWPNHGLVRFAACSGRFLRTRAVLCFLAGPLANVACAVGAYLLADAMRGTADARVAWSMGAACYVACGMAIVGLLPWTPGSRQEYEADIVQVWRLLQTDAAAVAASVQSSSALAGHHDFWHAFLRGRVDEAQRLAEAAAKAHPEDFAWACNASLVAFVRGDSDSVFALQQQYEVGVAAALARWDRERNGEPTGRELAMRQQLLEATRVNRAFYLVHAGTPEALGQALRLTEGTFTHGPTRAPGQVAMSRTRGLVLLHVGRVGEGIRELRAAVASAEPYWLRALGLACLAYGYALQGDARSARRCGRKARRLHPESPLLPARLRLAEEALQQTTAGAPSPAIR